MDLAERLDKLIAQDKLFEQGERIVVAASGGPDSTALLHLLFLLSGKWGWQLAAAHANHGFRPGESRREAEFVRRFARDRGLPFLYEELDVPGELRRRGGNPQDRARELRYQFLLRAAVENGAGKIALAHHADDQAETVLMRLLRGTGVSGLAGIPVRRKEQNVELVRPLLRMYKQELLEDLERHGIGYCIDSSNETPKYTRNRIRLEALPYLSRYNPSIAEALNRLADLASADDDFLEREASLLCSRLASRETDRVRFSHRSYAELHVALQRRFLKLILNYLSPDTGSQDYSAVEQVRGTLQQTDKPNARLHITGDILLIREYDSILLARSTEDLEPVSYAYALEDREGEIWIPEASCRLVYGISEVPEADWRFDAPNASAHTAYFDAGALRFPLLARNRRVGDRMPVQGLNGSKKVKDIFIDDKVPAGLRERTPLVTDAEGNVLWIPGIRRSGLALVTEESSQVLCIRYLQT